MYDRLVELEPSPVAELNRAVAHAFAEGPEHGLELIDRIEGLDGYLRPAARADLLRRLDRRIEAAGRVPRGAGTDHERRRPPLSRAATAEVS